MDNVFDIVARFRARRPIGSIPDGDREPLLLVQTGSRFQPTPCSVGIRGLFPRGAAAGI